MSQALGRHHPPGDSTVPRAPRTRLDAFAGALAKPTGIKLWYAAVVAFCLAILIVTVLVLVYVMPEGNDVAGTVEFYDRYNTLLRGISVVLALVFLLGAIWSGAFIATLWSLDTSRNRMYTWVAVFSEILVLGLFFAESGILASTVLLSGHSPDELIHALHVTVFVSAALLGPVWVPFAWATLLISRRSGAFPSWFNTFCVVVIVIDLGTITGVFTLSGPLNGENGLIGAFAGVLGPVVWVGGVIAWEVVEWAGYRTRNSKGSKA